VRLISSGYVSYVLIEMGVQLRYMLVGGGVELLIMITLLCSYCKLRLAGYLGMGYHGVVICLAKVYDSDYLLSVQKCHLL
jgi:hypothetical protein